VLTGIACIFPRLLHRQLDHWPVRIGASFPTISVDFVESPSGNAVPIDMDEWRAPGLSFWDFDARVEEAVAGGSTILAIHGRRPYGIRHLVGLLTRCQRLVKRRNRHTAGPAFDRILRAHHALYDPRKPLLLADYRHALDTWQWTLRLDPAASSALQIAALLHDVERLTSEADVRVEHRAPNYEKFKVAHARRGSEIAGVFLHGVGSSSSAIERITGLVARHEVPDHDEELALLNDADALSFFSLNSPGFLDYYGREHTTRKIHYTLARLRPSAMAHLQTVRLRNDVARLTRDALADRDVHPAVGVS
jgi:hypothetical protein